MYLLKTWAAEFTNSPEKVVRPNLTGASLAFPPRDLLPQSHLDLMDEMCGSRKIIMSPRDSCSRPMPQPL